MFWRGDTSGKIRWTINMELDTEWAILSVCMRDQWQYHVTAEQNFKRE